MRTKVIYAGVTYSSKTEMITTNMAAGLNCDLVLSRLRNGWSLENALTKKRGSNNPDRSQYRYKGKYYDTQEELIVANKNPLISYRGVLNRVNRNWSFEDALNLPSGSRKPKY